jgi:magnesium transporter
MRKLIRRVSRKAGLPPGALVHIGDRSAAKPRITIFDYDQEHFEEKEAASIDECHPYKDMPTVTWINVCGLHDTSILETLGGCYGVHPLVLEDILNTEQRPKLEDFRDYIFVVLKMLYLGRESSEVTAEQISLVIGPNFVLSFQERPEDVFEAVRERIRNAKGRIRSAGADHLAYALLDAVVDNYFVVLERFAGEIEDLEDQLVADPTAETLQDIHRTKRELIFLRRSVWPLREVLAALGRGDLPLIEQRTQPYIRDVYDHTIQVIDTTESLRDVVSGMHDTYLSSLSHRMNEIMKVLTIIATIFIPLTFMAGIYGMNFDYMPELNWHWSYPMLWAAMAGVGIAMVAYFRRKRWL